jgi:hypothetical protein
MFSADSHFDQLARTNTGNEVVPLSEGQVYCIVVFSDRHSMFGELHGWAFSAKLAIQHDPARFHGETSFPNAAATIRVVSLRL